MGKIWGEMWNARCLDSRLQRLQDSKIDMSILKILQSCKTLPVNNGRPYRDSAESVSVSVSVSQLVLVSVSQPEWVLVLGPAQYLQSSRQTHHRDFEDHLRY